MYKQILVAVMAAWLSGVGPNTAHADTFSVDVPENEVRAEHGRQIDEYVSRLAKMGFSGSVLVAEDGQVIYHNAYGITDPETRTPIRTNTAFSTASVTKQFTATGIMYLVQEGKLRVDDPITRFFEDVPADKQNMTVHHLLSNSSGLEGQFGPDEESTSRDEVVKRILNSELLSPPGEEYHYSNAGFTLLAAIIENVTGQQYEAFMREQLWLPTGMQHTGVLLPEYPDTLVAHSLSPMADFVSPASRTGREWNLIGNGGVLSTTGDMYRWLRMLDNGGPLAAEYYDLMTTPYIPEYEDSLTWYGYGWVVQEWREGDTLIWHNGGAMPHGWSSSVYRFRDLDADVIVLSNKVFNGAMPTDHIAAACGRIVAGLDNALPPAVVSLSQEAVRAAAGTYVADDGSRLVIHTTADGLRVVAEGQELLDLLYPSRFAPMLPKYNGLTREMIDAMADGRYEDAAEKFSPGQPLDRRVTMLRDWWQSFGANGEVDTVHILGTRFADGARTLARVEFANASKLLEFGWMRGQCEGLMQPSIDDLGAIFFPVTEKRFVQYDLAEGQTVELVFDGQTARLSYEGQTMTFEKI